MDFTKLQAITTKDKISKINSDKNFIIGCDPYNNRSYYNLYVYSLCDNRIIETRYSIPHVNIINRIRKLIKFYKKKNCKVLRNFRL